MDLVVELRNMEGINTSFDYGVELVVMKIKETIGDYDDIKNAIVKLENDFENLFLYDRVCGNGFRVAKDFVFKYVEFHNMYLDFIREFRYDTYVYAMISEEIITLLCGGMGEIWKQNQIEDLCGMLEVHGFNYEYKDTRNDDVEFRVLMS